MGILPAESFYVSKHNCCVRSVGLLCHGFNLFPAGQGIRVPEQISVAGFDDIPMCRMFCPTLTTVKQDGALRAKIAVEKLGELKMGKLIQNEIRLPVSLVVRASTK